jgi:hypothetical protein
VCDGGVCGGEAEEHKEDAVGEADDLDHFGVSGDILDRHGDAEEQEVAGSFQPSDEAQSTDRGAEHGDSIFLEPCGYPFEAGLPKSHGDPI